MPLRDFDPTRDPTTTKTNFTNPYVEELRLALELGTLPVSYGAAVVGKRGRWRDLHPQPSTARLIVEIGCHKGSTITALAQDHPGDLLVGADITFKRVVTSAKLGAKLGLKNMHCAMANAKAVRDIFADMEVDGFVIFFPDPWPKKRHAKNRLLSQKFCLDMYEALRPDGFVWLKTDQASYMEMSIENMILAGFSRVKTHPIAAKTYLSSFEQRFAAQGLATFSQLWQKTLRLS